MILAIFFDYFYISSVFNHFSSVFKLRISFKLRLSPVDPAWLTNIDLRCFAVSQSPRISCICSYVNSHLFSLLCLFSDQENIKNVQSVYWRLLSTVPNFCQYSGPESQGATKTRRMQLFSTGFVYLQCEVKWIKVKWYIL